MFAYFRFFNQSVFSKGRNIFKCGFIYHQLSVFSCVKTIPQERLVLIHVTWLFKLSNPDDLTIFNLCSLVQIKGLRCFGETCCTTSTSEARYSRYVLFYNSFKNNRLNFSFITKVFWLLWKKLLCLLAIKHL